MKKKFFKVQNLAAIFTSFTVLLILDNALAQCPTGYDCVVFEAALAKGMHRPPVYIVTDQPVKATMKVWVRAGEFRRVARKTAKVNPGRIAIPIRWKVTDNKGFIKPALYVFCITANELSTGKSIPIKKFGIAIGYPTIWDAINAVRITAIVPDPVEGEAMVRYSLGSEATVTMDILNQGGDKIDNVIKEQQRKVGSNEETWIRCEEAQSGSYRVKVESEDGTGTAKDFMDFTCK